MKRDVRNKIFVICIKVNVLRIFEWQVQDLCFLTMALNFWVAMILLAGITQSARQDNGLEFFCRWCTHASVIHTTKPKFLLRQMVTTLLSFLLYHRTELTNARDLKATRYLPMFLLFLLHFIVQILDQYAQYGEVIFKIVYIESQQPNLGDYSRVNCKR